MADQTTDDGFPLLPADADLDAVDELSLQDAISGAEPIAVPADDLPPLGRAPAFDFVTERIIPGVAGGPLMTTGDETLRGWIDKCVRTRRGESPAVDPDFGCDIIAQDVLEEGAPFDAALVAEWFAAIQRGLLVHPRITSVEDLQTSSGADDGIVLMSFRVIPEGDDIDAIEFDNVPLGG